MDIQICVDYKGLSFVLHVTAMSYTAECAATYFEPGTPAYTEIVDGWVELDGDVCDITYITSADMDIIMQMGYDNQSLFEAICEVHAVRIEERLLQYVKTKYCDDYRGAVI
jgi:hypothetical protein